jgi:hypothetical protein
MEQVNLALVAGSTTRFAVVDSERDAGYTIEGTLQVKVPKNSKPGAELEVVFVTDHVWPIDPLWDGQGKPPSQIKAEADQALRQQLDDDAAEKRENVEKGKPAPAAA